MTHLLYHHGYVGLFLVMFMEVIGIPSVGEAALITAGVQVERGAWPVIPVFLLAVAGNMAGVSLAYWIGRSLGRPIVLRYGAWLGLTDERLRRAETVFGKYGLAIVIVGKWIPAVQALVPYLAGFHRMYFRAFFFYSLMGTMLWIGIFLFVGRSVSSLVRRYGVWMLHHPLLALAWAVFVVCGSVLLWKVWRPAK